VAVLALCPGPVAAAASWTSLQNLQYSTKEGENTEIGYVYRLRLFKETAAYELCFYYTSRQSAEHSLYEVKRACLRTFEWIGLMGSMTMPIYYVYIRLAKYHPPDQLTQHCSTIILLDCGWSMTSEACIVQISIENAVLYMLQVYYVLVNNQDTADRSPKNRHVQHGDDPP